MATISVSTVWLMGLFSLVIVLIFVWAGTRLATRHLGKTRGGVLGLLSDLEGWPSLPLLQLYVWTAIAAFAVLWVSLVRLASGATDVMPEIPANLLTIVGIGIITTPISASVSHRNYSAKDAPLAPTKVGLTEEQIEDHKDHWHSMFLEKGRPTLTRYQVFIWTLIAVTIYLLTLWGVMSSPLDLAAAKELSIPDLSEVFVALMGLSQVGYVGGKLVAGQKKE